jgi:hypothetical protein
MSRAIVPSYYASLMVIGGLVACHERTVPETTIESPPIRFLYDASSPRPCEGTVPFLSQTTIAMSNYLGVRIPNRIDYHYRSSGNLAGHCPSSAPACTFEQDGTPTVWSRYANMPHELVHAIVLPVQPVRFFAEGLAVALGGNDGNLDSPPNQFTPEQLLDNDGTALGETLFFATAGDFSSYSLDRWGPSPYAQLNPRIPNGTSTVDVETTFSSDYGETLASALSDRHGSGKEYAGSRLGFPECNIAPTPWLGGVWNATGTLDCSSNGVSINDDLSPMNATYGAVDVQSDGMYSIALRGDNNALNQFFSWQRCISGEQFQYFPSDSPVSTHVVISGRTPTIAAWLAAGRYFAQFAAVRNAPADFAMAAQTTSSAGTDCTISSQSIDSSDGIYLIPRWDGPTVVTSFSVSTARTATAVVQQASLFLCDGTCDMMGTGCDALSLDDSRSLNPGHRYFVVTHGMGIHAFAGLAVPY